MKRGDGQTCMANEKVHRGVGGAVRGEAHAVALEHGAGARVGVHMPVPGGIHLRQHQSHSKAAHTICLAAGRPQTLADSLGKALAHKLETSPHPGCLASMYAVHVGRAMAADRQPPFGLIVCSTEHQPT